MISKIHEELFYISPLKRRAIIEVQSGCHGIGKIDPQGSIQLDKYQHTESENIPIFY